MVHLSPEYSVSLNRVRAQRAISIHSTQYEIEFNQKIVIVYIELTSILRPVSTPYPILAAVTEHHLGT
jgi:hypothetical protein